MKSAAGMLLLVLLAVGISAIAATPLASAAARRATAVASLKRFDQLAAMASRGDPEGCRIALAELEALEAVGATFELGPNAHNRAMRVCSSEPEVVETLYSRLAELGQQDLASLEALAAVRLENDKLEAAAEAVGSMLAPALQVTTSKAGRVLQRRKLPVRVTRISQSVLDACREAQLPEDALGDAPRLWRELGELGLWSPPPPPPALERTLALLKPDCLQAGYDRDVEAAILAHGFRCVRRRRWRMSAAEAADFLATSWGSSSGDRERRFFTEMVAFYSSGDVLALLLEREGGIAEWRQLLGPGDPAACRGYVDRHGRTHRPKAPSSVRARWGRNKQQNAACATHATLPRRERTCGLHPYL